MSESIKYFEENHYLKVEQVISEEEASYFYDYICLCFLIVFVTWEIRDANWASA